MSKAASPQTQASASLQPGTRGPDAGAQPTAHITGPATVLALTHAPDQALADSSPGMRASGGILDGRPSDIASSSAHLPAPSAGHCAELSPSSSPSPATGSGDPMPSGSAGGVSIDINLDLDLGAPGPDQPLHPAEAATALVGAQDSAASDKTGAHPPSLASSQASTLPAPTGSADAGHHHDGNLDVGGPPWPAPRRRTGLVDADTGTDMEAPPGSAAATGTAGMATPATASALTQPQVTPGGDVTADLPVSLGDTPVNTDTDAHVGPHADTSTASPADLDTAASVPAVSSARGRATRRRRGRGRGRRKPASLPLRLLGALWRSLLWLVLALLALLLLCAAMLWLFNWRDEPLRPDLQQALDFRPPDAQAMHRNGYFAMLGLTAPASENARAAGERFFIAQMQGLDSYRLYGLPAAPTEEAFSQQPLALGVLSCAAATHDCLVHYQRQLPEIRTALARLAHVQQRYLALADAPTYEEVLPPYTLLPRPPYADLRAASELVLMQAVVHLNDGHVSDALALLARNAALHQRLVQGARSRLGALSAIGMQLRQQRLISDILRQQPELARSQALAWQATLAADPLPLGPALQGQVNWTVGAAYADFSLSLPLSWSPDDPWPQQLKGRLLEPLYRLTWLPQATLNRLWLRERAAAALGAQPAQWLDAQVHELLRTFPDSGTLDAPAGQGFSLRLDDLRRLHNYVGQALLSIWSPRALVDDIERAHDTEGHRRLVLLQLAALQQNLRPAALPGWLAASPPEWRNPYTLTPMEWDAATDSLLFTGRQTAQQNPDASRQWRVRMPSLSP